MDTRNLVHSFSLIVNRKNEDYAPVFVRVFWQPSKPQQNIHAQKPHKNNETNVAMETGVASIYSNRKSGKFYRSLKSREKQDKATKKIKIKQRLVKISLIIYLALAV